MTDKVLIFCPTYKDADGNLAAHPRALSKVQSLNFSGGIDVEISTQNPYPPPDIRNVLTQYQAARQEALGGEYDALLTVEHDIIVPPDALQLLWETGAPVAYGVYLFRGHQNIANVFRLVNETRPNMAACRKLLAKAVQKQVIDVNGAGMGCLLICREVLDKIEFRTTAMNTAPDFPFAKDCAALGVKQVAHFGVQCGHVVADTNHPNGKTIYLDLRYADLSWRAARTGNRRPWVREEGGVVIKEPVATKRLRANISIKSDLRIAVKARRGKEANLVAALQAGSFSMTGHEKTGDALLIDHDMPQYGFREIINRHKAAGAKVFIYPHGAAPILSWDGMMSPYEKVDANLVPAPGHAEVMRRYGYPLPVHVIGWFYCEQKPWQPARGKRVLFAPIHPVGDGSFKYPGDLELNRRIFRGLLNLPDVQLTVRYIGSMAANGLHEEPGVTYVCGKLDNSIEDIDRADIVVGNGTFAYLAIARGKPTVMLGQLTGARNLVKGQVLQAGNLGRYREYMRYPFDAEDGDLASILEKAGRTEPVEWKALFIGEQMQPEKFCDLLKSLIAEEKLAQPISPTLTVRTSSSAPSRRMAAERGIYYIHPHQGKELAYTRALGKAGYRSVQTVNARLRFALADLDGSRHGNGKVVYRDWLERLHKAEISIFIYPHAARPMVQWDGLMQPWPHTKCTFVIAAGHQEVMQRFGYPIMTEIAGWSLCEIKDFQPVSQVKNILFGPIHPAANGWMPDVDKDLNRRAFARLLDYCKETGASLTVRHIQPLERSGLAPAPGVKYVRARPDGSTREIDAVDLVVGHQTFAYLAVARGKPVLMVGEDTPPRSGIAPSNFRYVASWEKYADYLMFPLDILNGTTSDVVEKAIKPNKAVAAWREKFIGEAFCPSKFVEKLESYL